MIVINVDTVPDVPKEKIPVYQKDGVLVRVIAGEAFGTKAVVETKVPIQYLDFNVEKGAEFSHSLPPYGITIFDQS